MAYEILKPQLCRPVQGVLFDMDGVVLDSETLYNRFWMEAVQELGYPMTWEQTLGLRSLDHVRGQAYLTDCFGPGIDYNAAREIRIRRMDAWISARGVEPKTGIYALLDWLDCRKIPRAITTSSPPERVKSHLTPLGLYGRFDRICSGYEVAHGKPEPDLYFFGAARLGLEPACCLALEDSPAGIESAHRAGCLAVVIPDQDEPDRATLSRSFARADSLVDIMDLLMELNG